jgi:hypothetical protein
MSAQSEAQPIEEPMSEQPMAVPSEQPIPLPMAQQSDLPIVPPMAALPSHQQRYPVVDPSAGDLFRHVWADYAPRAAIRIMSRLLETLMSHPPLDSAIMRIKFKPFTVQNLVWNTEFVYLIHKVHAVWEQTEEHISTHQLHHFYQLVVGEVDTHLPYITTIRGVRTSWFVNRPGTEEWTSVQHNMQIADDTEQFARLFLYGNNTSILQRRSEPLNLHRPMTLRTANQSDLYNIINASNVLGPRHKITKRIVRQWINELVHKHTSNKGRSDDLGIIFDQIDYMPSV